MICLLLPPCYSIDMYPLKALQILLLQKLGQKRTMHSNFETSATFKDQFHDTQVCLVSSVKSESGLLS